MGVGDGVGVGDTDGVDDPEAEGVAVLLPLLVGLTVMDGVVEDEVDTEGVADTHSPLPVSTCTLPTPRPAVSNELVKAHCTVSVREDAVCGTSTMIAREVSVPHPAGRFTGSSGKPHVGEDASSVYPAVNLPKVATAAPSTSTLNVSSASQSSIATAVRDTRTVVCVGRPVTTCDVLMEPPKAPKPPRTR